MRANSLSDLTQVLISLICAEMTQTKKRDEISMLRAGTTPQSDRLLGLARGAPARA
jgi:hypothetical protein